MQINSLEELEQLFIDLPLTDEEKQKTRERFLNLKTPQDHQNFQGDLENLITAQKILEIDAQTIEALNNKEELENADRKTLLKIVEEQKQKSDQAKQEALRSKLNNAQSPQQPQHS